MLKISLTREAPASVKADVVAICVGNEPLKDSLVRDVDKRSKGQLKQALSDHEFKGNDGQCVLWPAPKGMECRYVAIVGVGAEKQLGPRGYRDAAATAVQTSKRVQATSLAVFVPTPKKSKAGAAVHQAVLGAQLAAYSFQQYKSKKKPLALKSVVVAVERAGGKALDAAQRRKLKPAATRATAIAQAVYNARDFVNLPAADLTPSKLASEARKIGRKHSVTVKVLGRKECERLGMGMFLAVARGSVEEPKLIHMTYKPKAKAKRKIALVGKGITFDSGGYSLKPGAAMMGMKVDMGGAAAVISAMGAIASIGCPHEVHAIAPCAENLISGNAYKLGDVLHAMDGTMVEINNTDAEGRLALGDAIAYARKVVKPDEMFDFATLTGACMIALGPYTAGVMSDHDELAEKFLEAGSEMAESLWRLPLIPDLRRQLKSPIADMRNSGQRYGGAITAGLFLQNFVKDTPWVHVDIAGPASPDHALGPAVPKGGTGFGVATIVEYVTTR